MHSIRLRGPWELHLPGREPQRLEMPATWGTISVLAWESPIRLVRRFGQPTGIAPLDHLHLVIDSAACECRVELNGQLLGSIDSSQLSSSFNVTTLLTDRNELAIIFDSLSQQQPAPSSGTAPLSDIRLEIT